MQRAFYVLCKCTNSTCMRLLVVPGVKVFQILSLKETVGSKCGYSSNHNALLTYTEVSFMIHGEEGGPL